MAGAIASSIQGGLISSFSAASQSRTPAARAEGGNLCVFWGFVQHLHVSLLPSNKEKMAATLMSHCRKETGLII